MAPGKRAISRKRIESESAERGGSDRQRHGWKSPACASTVAQIQGSMRSKSALASALR